MHFSSMLSKYLANIYSLGVYKNSIRNEFIKVKSYENEKSTGCVHISGIEHIPLEGKDVLIIEDIVDSGLTMKALISELEVKIGIFFVKNRIINRNRKLVR